METKTLPTVRFRKWNCTIEIHHYINGRKCLELLDKKTGEPIATATVNLPEEHTADDEVFIKNYSENEGMLEALIIAGIVKDTGIRVPSGMVYIPKAKLLI